MVGLRGTQAACTARHVHTAAAVVGVLTLLVMGILTSGNPPLAAAARYGGAPGTGAQPETATVLHKVTSVRIYLVAINDQGRSGTRIGCGDSLVAVTRPIRPTVAPLSAALRLLLADHRRFYGQSGLYNALYQSRLSLQHAAVSKGRATIYLVGTMRLGGVCDNPRVDAQLKATARQFPTVHAVSIYVNNVPLWKRLHG